MTNKHPTMGPWKTGREDMESYDGATGISFTNIYHATLKDGTYMGMPLPVVIGRAEGDNNKANAKLMAAAPDLLEALLDCVVLFQNALPKFNWGASALDAEAIRLLNEVPNKALAALTKAGL